VDGLRQDPGALACCTVVAAALLVLSAWLMLRKVCLSWMGGCSWGPLDNAPLILPYCHLMILDLAEREISGRADSRLRVEPPYRMPGSGAARPAS
jgi:hypothetical protein